MWDSFLVKLATHPFLAVILSLSGFMILTAFRKKNIILKLISYFSVIVALVLVIIFQFRWDSFSIQFNVLDSQRLAFNKILFIGDSITHEGTRPRGFITKLKSILPIQTNVFSKPGANTIAIRDSVKNIPNHINPNLVVVQSGINDLSEGISKQKVNFHQIDLLNQIKSSFPTAKIWFLPIHPISLSKETTHFSHYTCEWWEDAESFKAKFLLKDGIHLSAKGHTKLAISLAKKLVIADHTL